MKNNEKVILLAEDLSVPSMPKRAYQINLNDSVVGAVIHINGHLNNLETLVEHLKNERKL